MTFSFPGSQDLRQLKVSHRATSANELLFTQTKPVSVFRLVLSWGTLLKGEFLNASFMVITPLLGFTEAHRGVFSEEQRIWPLMLPEAVGKLSLDPPDSPQQTSRSSGPLQLNICSLQWQEKGEEMSQGSLTSFKFCC